MDHRRVRLMRMLTNACLDLIGKTRRYVEAQQEGILERLGRKTPGS